MHTSAVFLDLPKAFIMWIIRDQCTSLILMVLLALLTFGLPVIFLEDLIKLIFSEHQGHSQDFLKEVLNSAKKFTTWKNICLVILDSTHLPAYDYSHYS